MEVTLAFEGLIHRGRVFQVDYESLNEEEELYTISNWI